MTTLGAQIISDKPEKMRDTILWLRSLNLFDEIVAVADVDNGLDIIESAKLADRYTTLKFEHQEQAIDTAISLSTTDWQFRIDDDERMGARFKEYARYLLNHNDVDVYWFPRMWIYPDEKHFLTNPLWYPDIQPRLWRKGFLKATPGIHMHPTTKGANEINYGINIFHYILIQNTYEQRIQRCEMQAKMLGITLEQYKPGMATYYLPEDHKDMATIGGLLEEL